MKSYQKWIFSRLVLNEIEAVEQRWYFRRSLAFWYVPYLVKLGYLLLSVTIPIDYTRNYLLTHKNIGR